MENLKNMDQQSPETVKNPSSQPTSNQTEEKTFYQRLNELPYNKERLGQAFIMSFSKPSETTKPSSKEYDPEDSEEDTQL